MRRAHYPVVITMVQEKNPQQRNKQTTDTQIQRLNSKSCHSYLGIVHWNDNCNSKRIQQNIFKTPYYIECDTFLRKIHSAMIYSYLIYIIRNKRSTIYVRYVGSMLLDKHCRCSLILMV